MTKLNMNDPNIIVIQTIWISTLNSCPGSQVPLPAGRLPQVRAAEAEKECWRVPGLQRLLGPRREVTSKHP